MLNLTCIDSLPNFIEISMLFHHFIALILNNLTDLLYGYRWNFRFLMPQSSKLSYSMFSIQHVYLTCHRSKSYYLLMFVKLN